jgi:hypothetical protein
MFKTTIAAAALVMTIAITVTAQAAEPGFEKQVAVARAAYDTALKSLAPDQREVLNALDKGLPATVANDLKMVETQAKLSHCVKTDKALAASRGELATMLKLYAMPKAEEQAKTVKAHSEKAIKEVRFMDHKTLFGHFAAESQSMIAKAARAAEKKMKDGGYKDTDCKKLVKDIEQGARVTRDKILKSQREIISQFDAAKKKLGADDAKKLAALDQEFAATMQPTAKILDLTARMQYCAAKDPVVSKDPGKYEKPFVRWRGNLMTKQDRDWDAHKAKVAKFKAIPAKLMQAHYMQLHSALMQQAVEGTRKSVEVRAAHKQIDCAATVKEMGG